MSVASSFLIGYVGALSIPSATSTEILHNGGVDEHLEQRHSGTWHNAELVAQWIAQNDHTAAAGGKDAFGRLLRHFKLPTSLRDTLADKLLDAAHGLDARGERIENIEAWVTTVLTWRATDLFRAEKRRKRDLEGMKNTIKADRDEPSDYDIEDDGGEVDEETQPPPVSPGSRPNERADRYLDRMRALIVSGELAFMDRLPKPQEISAVLTYIAIHYEGLEPGGNRVPTRPDLEGHRHAIHLGLWYAGMRDCFPRAGGLDSQAIRRKRSRRVDAVERALTGLLDMLREEESQ